MDDSKRQPGPFAAGSRAVILILGVAGVGMLIGVPLLLNSPKMSFTLMNAVVGGRQFKAHEHDLVNALTSLDRAIAANDWRTVARIAERATGIIEDTNRSDGRWSGVMLWRIKAARETGAMAEADKLVRAWWTRLIELLTWRDIANANAPRRQDIQSWQADLPKAKDSFGSKELEEALVVAYGALRDCTNRAPTLAELDALRAQAAPTATVADAAPPSQ